MVRQLYRLIGRQFIPDSKLLLYKQIVKLIYGRTELPYRAVLCAFQSINYSVNELQNIILRTIVDANRYSRDDISYSDVPIRMSLWSLVK